MSTVQFLAPTCWAVLIICNQPHLDINRGAKICIRLRPHFDDGAFFEEHDVIGTMLHEASIHHLDDEVNPVEETMKQ